MFAAGHANGGMMVYRLACQLSDRISAIAVNAAEPLNKDYRSCMTACEPYEEPPCKQRFNPTACPARTLPFLPSVYQCLMRRPVSILHMHGVLDTRVPYRGGVGLKQLGNASFIPVPTLVNNILAPLLKCSPMRRLTFLNKTDTNDITLCEEYKGCRRARLQFCKLKNGGHHIPGGRLPKYCDITDSSYKKNFCSSWEKLLGPPTNSIMFAETSWHFFKSLLKRKKGINKGPRSAMSVRGKGSRFTISYSVTTLEACIILIPVVFR